jgi:RNA polymerase sigma-70 factor, ECF subfamily
VQGTPTSLSLLLRVRDRQDDAWHRLLYLYSPLVQFWCRQWGTQGADADDIVQNVFLVVSAKLETFRRDRPGDTFRGWLRTIAHRKFLDHCRAQRQRPELLIDPDARPERSPVALLEEEPANDPPEELRRLRLRGLDLVRGEFEEKTWQAFWRCAVDGRPPAEVAEEMAMTPAGVRKAKSRVLMRLRQELGELLE